MLSASVAGSNGAFGPPFDNMTLLVHLEDRWLADVGFGDSFDFPLPLDSDEIQTQIPRAYRLDDDPEYRKILRQMDREGVWADQYRFDLVPHQMGDYVRMCTFHQTSPESHFTQGRICTRRTPEGRITLSGMRLITTRNDERSESILSSEAEVGQVLRNYFGIDPSM
jgi:N-hydroxyarylamine O-acetyltransferase